jgi:hypothetical protein
MIRPFTAVDIIIPTNMLLVKIGIKESHQSNFCNNDTVSILHYIWLCPIIKVFWQQVIVLLEEIFEISIEYQKHVCW